MFLKYYMYALKRPHVSLWFSVLILVLPRTICEVGDGTGKARSWSSSNGRSSLIQTIIHQGSQIPPIMSANDEGFKIALEEAKKGANEGGVPIGACLVASNGKIIGRGHNLRVQRNSAILHVRRDVRLLINMYFVMTA